MLGTLDVRETALKRKELTELLVKLDLAPVDRTLIDRAKSSFAVNLRVLDAIHSTSCARRSTRSRGRDQERPFS